jgi:NADH-quinone oxidoreductase subunit H
MGFMVIIVKGLIAVLLAFIIGIFFLGLSRRIMARIHWRYGPPLIQPVIDIIKLFNQDSISHGFIFSFGIILSLVGSFVVILFLPVGNICSLSSTGGLLVILYIMLISPLSIALSGGEAANPNTSIGISRKFILALAYEVPLLLIFLAVMSYYNTISIVKIVQIQSTQGWSFGTLTLLLSGISYVLVLPAILGVRPFEIISAPQEIASGPIVEYGGKFLGFTTIQHALTEFIGIALFVNLFLGGWSLFGVLEPFTGTVWFAIFGLIIFFIKMLIVFTLVLFVNAVFPRFRIEQAIKYLWGWPTVIAFAGLIVTMIIK